MRFPGLARSAIAITLPLIVHLFAPAPSAADLADGLVAYWSFDTGFQATAGGSSYNAVPYNGAVVDTGGRFGGAASFARADTHYVVISAPVITQGQNHTYSAWYRSDVADMAPTGFYYVLETSGVGSTLVGSASYRLQDTGTGDEGRVYTSWSGGSASTSLAGAAGTGWHNIIVTYDTSAAGNEHRIYLDGSFVTTLASADSLDDAAGLVIGGTFNDLGQTWDGLIDDVAFWARVLTTGEIGALQNRPVLPFQGIGAGLPKIVAQRRSMDWGDYDNDGDLDLLLTGYEIDLHTPITRVYRNNGDATFTDVVAGLSAGVTGTAAWGDYDNDGDLDLALSGRGTSSRVYRNEGSPTFAFHDIGVSLPEVQEGTLAWGDYDNDGDLDLLLTGSTVATFSPIARVYNNAGSDQFIDANAGLPGVYNGESAWVDFDNDGDLDLYLGGVSEEAGSPFLYRNDAGSFALVTGTGLNSNSSYSVDWSDYDSDGDLDLLTSTNGVYRNNGPPDFHFTNIGTGLPRAYAGAAHWGDYDNDGDLDVLITGFDYWYPTDPAFSRIYRNDAGAFTDIGAGLPGSYNSTCAWGDFDNDGDLDFVLAGDSFYAEIYCNRWASPNTLPGTPTALVGQMNGRRATLSWNPASDAETPSSALSYNLRVGTSPGAEDIVAAMADSSSGYRRVARWGNAQNQTSWSIDLPTAGNYYWSVQAVDGAFAGSPFATEQTIVAADTIQFAVVDAGLDGVAGSKGRWADYDRDGDLDVALAGDTGSGYLARIYENDGAGAFSDIGAGLPGVTVAALAWGDYDNDGDVDLAMAGNTGSGYISRIYRNDGGGGFTDIAAGLPGVSTGSVAWGDYDNDGDLDLVVTGDAGGSRISRIYRNDSGAFTDIAAGLPGISASSVGWDDYDSDGDLDLLLCGHTGSAGMTKIYRNDAGQFTDIAAGLLGVYHGSVAWGDYDSDGDPDLVASGWTGSAYYTRVYRNDAGSFVDIGAGLPGLVDCAVGWGDFDNDGNLDLSLAGYTGTEYVSRIYRNQSGTFTDMSAGLPGVRWGSLAWGDSDNDGDLDLLLAGWTGTGYVSRICRNDGAWPNTDPGVPTALSVQLQDSLATFSWSPTFDAETPAAGLTYNLRIGTTPGGGEISAAMADSTNGYRRVVETGNCRHQTSWTIDLPAEALYYWSVQAVDGGYAGSPFAAEQVLAATRISFTNLEAGLPGVSFCSGAWGDYDNDGDLDLYLKGIVYRHDGGGSFTAKDAGLPGGSNSSGTWGDYDNDGDLDILVSGYSGQYYARIYRSSGGADPSFTDIGAGLPNLSGCVGAWGDYDNDGDLDLVLANSVYRNNGGPNPTFTDVGAGIPGEPGLPGVGYSSAAWGDYDNDGDLDILLVTALTTGSGYGATRVYKNDLGLFTDAGAGLPGFWLGTRSGSASWGDYDNDGDLDILLTGATASGNVLRVYENDAGVFTNIATDLPGASYGCAAWGDYDNDGDLDILLTGITTSGPLTNVYRNLGSGVFSEVFTGLPALYQSWGAWADYDADGDLDIVVAGNTGAGGLSAIYQSDGADPNTPPTAPTCLPVSVVGSRIQLKWSAASDGETSSPGLSYNLRVGTTPGGAEIATPMSDPSSGYHHLAQLGPVLHRTWWGLKLPEGHYYWSIQAVDGSFSGSPFAAEAEFDVDQARPDLVIEPAGLSATPVGPDTLLLTAIVTNAGFAQAPASVVRFFDGRMDAVLGPDVAIPALDPGASDTCSVPWTAECNHDRFRAQVDPDGLIVEIYDGNNSAELDFGESLGIYPCIRAEVARIEAAFGTRNTANTFGTYLQGMEGSREAFTVTLDDPDNVVTRVALVVGNRDTVWVTEGSDWTYDDFDPGSLCHDDTMRVTAFDDARAVSEEEVCILKTREMPEWLRTWFNLGVGPVGLEVDDQGRSYLTFELALSAEKTDTTAAPDTSSKSFLSWKNEITSSIPIMGGKKTSMKLDFNFKISYPLLDNYGWIVHGDVKKTETVFGRKGTTPPIGMTVEVSPDGKHITHVKLDPPYSKRVRLWRSPSIKSPAYMVGPVRVIFAVSMDLFVNALIEAEAWDDLDSLEVVFTPSVETDLKVTGTATIPGFKFAKVQVIANPNFRLGPIFTYARSGGVNDFAIDGFWEFKLSGKVVASVTFKVWRVKKTKKWTVAEFRAGPWGDVFEIYDKPDGLAPLIAAEEDTDWVEVYLPDMFPYPNAATDPLGHVGIVWIQDTDPDSAGVLPQVYHAELDSASGSWESEPVTADSLFKSYATFDYLPSGDPLAVWVQASYTEAEVDTGWTFSEVLDRQDLWYAARIGESWTPAPLLTESPGVHRADGTPDITRTDSGALLLWARAGAGDSALATGSSEIYYATYAGGAWSTPDSLTNDGLDDTFPAVCATNPDTAVALWLRQGATPPNELVWSRWDGSSWLDPPAVLSDGDWTKEPPSVTSGDGGGALAAWVETELVLPDSAVIYHLRAATLEAGASAWSSISEIAADSLFIEDPIVVIDRRNIAVVQWRGYDGMDGDLWYSSMDLDEGGSSWTLPRVIHPDTLNDWMATAAVDDDNNLYVIDLKSNLTEPPPEPSAAVSSFPGGLHVTAMGIANTLDLTDQLNTGFRPLSCDLTFGVDSLWIAETQPTVGDSATVMAYVKNIGDYASDTTTVRFYDGHPDSGVAFPGGDIVFPGLAPDESLAVSGRWPVAAGYHALYAVVDPDSTIGEQNESNNRDWMQVSIVPDLAVDSLAVSDPNPSPGDPLTLTAYVRNVGGAAATGYTLHFGGLAGPLDSLTALTLAPGADTTLTGSITVAQGVDTLYAVADPDSLLPDPDRTNNRAWHDLRVLPDLSVWIDHRTGVPDSVRFRDDYAESLKVTVGNLGGAALADTQTVAVRLYSSNPRAGGVPLLADIVWPLVFPPGLPPGAQDSMFVAWADLGTVLDSLGVSLDKEGLPVDPMAIFAAVDPDGLIEERSERNNEDFLSIGEGLPQLILLDGSIEIKPVDSAEDTLSVQVGNLGTTSCQGVLVEFFKGDPDTGGVLIDDRLIPRLVPGETMRAWIAWETPAEDMTIFACVDRSRQIAEHDETDNRISQAFSLQVHAPDAPPPLRLALHPALPNPFSDRATIRFDLPEAGSVRIQVFDVAGRLVRTLADEHYPAGRHSVFWDGHSNAQRTSAAGIYFVRLRANEEVRTQKIVKLQ